MSMFQKLQKKKIFKFENTNEHYKIHKFKIARKQN